MPHFAITQVVETRDVHAIRAECDGCDGPRPVEEHARTNRLWLLTAGCFELRDATRRQVLDPATMFVFAAGQAYTIRHPRGADTCLSFSGPLVDAIAGRGAGARTPDARDHARLLAEVAAWRRGDRDDLALAEAVCAAATPAEAPRAVTKRERELAGELAYLLRMRFAEAASTSLPALADAAGVSVFHACHVFRRVTGGGLHELRRELRLRHALALLIDGRAPIAEVAIDTGFASQSHLTNRFRDRFGVTPRAARLGALRSRPALRSRRA